MRRGEAGTGHLATINALLEGLVLRFADGSMALATLLAGREFHLPALVDSLAE